MSSVYSSCLSVLCFWPTKFDSYPSNMTFIKILFHSFAPTHNRLVIFGEMITANKLHLAWQQTPYIGYCWSLNEAQLILNLLHSGVCVCVCACVCICALCKNPCCSPPPDGLRSVFKVCVCV